MNLQAIDWNMIVGLTGIGGLIYGMFRNLKLDSRERFNSLQTSFSFLQASIEKISTKIDSLQDDMIEIKERIAFLEAANIYTMPLESPPPNARSQAAKEMWRKRRSKSIVHKQKND